MVQVETHNEETAASLADGSSITVTVATGQTTAETLLTQVDDNAGGAPNEYTLEQRSAHGGLEYMVFDRVTESTKRSFVDDVKPTSVEIELTNTSGTAANFRLRATVIGES